MAKAQFHRNQKVWVESVGAWATVEKIVPVWARGFEEPVRITYDVGLGREFHPHELRPEEAVEGEDSLDLGNWRLLRAKNKWQTTEDCTHHPYPGSYPVVVTDRQDWGGWRTPGAEYDRDPRKIEMQARLIAAAPQLLLAARELHALVAEAPEQVPEEFQSLAKRCGAIIRSLAEVPVAPNSAEIVVMAEQREKLAG
ncbi:MAG: hypothetical protein WCI21_09260 [Alphaproteobacteria bacterium]